MKKKSAKKTDDRAQGADGSKEEVKPRKMITAAKFGRVEILKRLLQDGGDPNTLAPGRVPILTLAVEQSQLEAVRLLLAAGADPDPKQGVKREGLPLWVAVQLKSGSDGAEVEASTSEPHLGHLDISAARGGGEVSRGHNSQIVHALMDAGARPRHADVLGYAIRNHTVEVVERLITAEAKLRCKQAYLDPLRCAVEDGRIDVLDLLVEAGVEVVERQNEDSLFQEAQYGARDWRSLQDLWEWLLAHGVSLNHRGRDGFTALHGTTRFCSLHAMEWLLAHGADIEARYSDQGTALDMLLDERDILDGDDDPFGAEELGVVNEMIDRLKAAGAKATDPSLLGPTEPEDPQAGIPVSDRRGLGIAQGDFYKVYQRIVLADIDRFTDMLDRDSAIMKVERDMYDRLGEIENDNHGAMAVIKLKGHDWLILAGGWMPIGDTAPKRWSKKLASMVLEVGHQSTAGMSYYHLYDRGKLVENFESDGLIFLDQESDECEDSDEVAGEGKRGDTFFESKRLEVKKFDFRAYPSDYGFIDSMLRELDAYVTHAWAGFQSRDDDNFKLIGKPDELVESAIERMDIAIYGSNF